MRLGLRVVPFVMALVATSALARPGERDQLNACKAMVDRAAQSAPAATAAPRSDEAALARCRQIIRDWTLRESRMSVDENGRPLR